MFSPQIMVLKTFIAAAGPREAKKKGKKIVYILMLVMVELEEGVERTGKKAGKKSSVYCSIPGGGFFGCVVAT